MLYFIVVWAGLLPLCWLVGITVLHWLSATCFMRLGDRTIAALWLGLVIIALVLLTTALVLPLSPWVGGIVAVSLGSLSLSHRPTRATLAILKPELSINRTLLVIGLGAAIAALSSSQISWVDTGLYHYSLIKWIASYGTVPGLALLLKNLGFTSAWFALAAPLSLPGVSASVLAVTNGFVLLLLTIGGVISIRHCLISTGKLSDWFLITYSMMMGTLVLSHPLFAGMLRSPSPDIPVMFMVGIVTWAMLVTLDQLTAPFPSSGVPLMLAAGAVTLQLMAMPLLLVMGLFYAWTTRGQLRALLLGLGMVSLFLIPLLVTSSITSGCPLYPSTAVCLDLPWSPSPESAPLIAGNTHSVLYWYGQPPADTHPWLWAMGQWFHQNRLNPVMVVVSGGTMVLLGYGLVWVGITKLQAHLWVLAIALFSLGFLALTIPIDRLTIPYAMILLALGVASLLGSIVRTRYRKMMPRLSRWCSQFKQPLVLAGSTAIASVVIATALPLPSRLLIPPAMVHNPIVQKQVNDIVYWSPQDREGKSGLCWSAPLPCAFKPDADVWLRDRDRGIAAGFTRR